MTPENHERVEMINKLNDARANLLAIVAQIEDQIDSLRMMDDINGDKIKIYGIKDYFGPL
jgi:hypothetical protein